MGAGPHGSVVCGESCLEKSNVSVRANHMRVQEVMEFINRERHEALAVRDPIAIALAAERYNTIAAALEEFPPTDVLDLYKPLLSVSQAAKLLGYNAKEVRRLLGQGKLSGKKINNQWRIPLKAVL
jgi:excisionase family DNA binding protein